MNVFVAGASGAIGLPLVRELIRRGHAVTGMTRSEGGAKNLARIGAVVAHVSAFDAAGVDTALRRSKAEVVIDELTALPKNPADMPDARWDFVDHTEPSGTSAGLSHNSRPGTSHLTVAVTL